MNFLYPRASGILSRIYVSYTKEYVFFVKQNEYIIQRISSLRIYQFSVDIHRDGCTLGTKVNDFTSIVRESNVFDDYRNNLEVII